MKKNFFLLLFIFAVSLPFGTAAQAQERPASIVTIDGESYYIHTVQRGETFYSLSREYSVTEDQIRSNNPLTADGLQEGIVIKIPARRQPENLTARQRNRLFETHVVLQGETLYSISRRYEIPVSTIIEDNEGLDPTKLEIGRRLNIRKKSRGDADEAHTTGQLEEYRDAINSVSEDFKYHLVEKGETLYFIGRLYEVEVDSILKYNDLPDGLKAGAMIRIPIPEEVIVEEIPDELTTGAGERQMQWSREGERENFAVADFTGTTPRIALLLPLKNDAGQPMRNFTEFYQGVLMALEDLKAEGISSRLDLYNTSRSPEKVYDIVNDFDFEDTDLIIGPVYEDVIDPVLQFASRHRIPVVSPLAVIDRHNSPLLYQMAADPAGRTPRYSELLPEDANIIFVKTANPDSRLESDIMPVLEKHRYNTLVYNRNMSASSFNSQIKRDVPNIFVISCSNETMVDEILAKLSSLQNNLAARSIANLDIRIVAGPDWARYDTSVDRNLYFKLRLSYITSYHADRSDQRVKEFDTRYIKNFGSIPTLFVYRGYDCAKLFVSAMMQEGDDFTRKLNESEATLLQIPYRFYQPQEGGINVNEFWGIVSYNNDYTIEVR